MLQDTRSSQKNRVARSAFTRLAHPMLNPIPTADFPASAGSRGNMDTGHKPDKKNRGPAVRGFGGPFLFKPSQPPLTRPTLGAAGSKRPVMRSPPDRPYIVTTQARAGRMLTCFGPPPFSEPRERLDGPPLARRLKPSQLRPAFSEDTQFWDCPRLE